MPFLRGRRDTGPKELTSISYEQEKLTHLIKSAVGYIISVHFRKMTTVGSGRGQL